MLTISDISIRPVSIPYKVPWRNRHTEEAGTPMTHLRTSIIEIKTSDEITGLGEFRTDGLEGDAAADVASGISDVALKKLNKILVGENPTEISRIIPILEREFGHGALVAGIDFALHDIKGKSFGVPVYELLGGKTRDKVPLVWTLPYLSIEEQVLQATSRVSEGFVHAVKMKVGIPGDTEHLLAVARSIKGIPIRPDSNMGHSKAEAIAQLTTLRREGVSLELVEDPCPTNFDDFQEIGDLFDLQISIHGGWSSFSDLSTIIRAGKSRVGCVNIMTTYWGLYRSAQIVGALETAGIGWTLGTSHDSSIKISAALHLATAMPNRIYPCDLLGPLLHVDDLASAPLQIHSGYGVAPDKPGLGIDLDEDVMSRWSVDASVRH